MPKEESRADRAAVTSAPPVVGFACPRCRAALAATADQLVCPGCAAHYPVVSGIPILSMLAADDPADEYKRRQIEFFDGEAAEFEITRPSGQPSLYGWLMAEKFRRSVRGMESFLPGASALTVCGGSGMDAEFLARQGASVIASDLSLGAAQRATERGRRLGLRIDAVVADVEHLPFADRSIDIVYVHDGLHHLDDPIVGLAEMCRVARCGVAITEPSRAAVTALAVRVGLSIQEEEAGNRVERVSAEQITACLADHGLHVVGADRYAMYYRHEPGRPMRFLSRRRTLPVARASVSAFNGVLGGIGNKLSVRGLRGHAVARTASRGGMSAPGLRVLRIIGLLDPDYGGTSQSSVSEAIATQRCGISNTFAFGIDPVSRGTTRAAQARLRSAGVVVKPFPLLPIARFHSRRWGLSVSLCGWILLHARHYDVIHVHQTWGLPQLAGLTAAVLSRRPCVITPHESLTSYDVEREKRFLKQCLKQAYLRYGSLTIFASELEATDSVGGITNVRTTVLPHPIPDEDVLAGSIVRRDAHVRRSRTNGPLTVGFLGRLDPKKNIHLLIDAVGAVDPAVRLRIAGDGPNELKRSLMDRADHVGVADRVEWLGFLDRPDHARFHSTIDVLALVSDYECFGVAAAEAMARAVPVLVSDRTGIAPIVAEYGCGLVIASDAAAIAEALRWLVSEPGRLEDLGARGPVAAREKLSMHAYGAEALRSYEEVAAATHGGVLRSVPLRSRGR